MTQLIQSAGYFTVITTSNHTYGFITLAGGQSEKRVLCRQHAYVQLEQLIAAKQLDTFEAMHIREQIAGSPLPSAVPDEFEGYIQQLIREGEDAVQSIFNTDYFHPAVQEFLKDAESTVHLPAITPLPTASTRLQ